MEYHVLSNYSMGIILLVGFLASFLLLPVFLILAQRDAVAVKKEKTIIRKIVPWILLCIFLSELSLLLYLYINYPWDIEPQPSQASAFREMNYLGSGYPIWGWANDYQLPIVSNLTGCVFWFCWTIYAFNFIPSDTSWWKKTCKVVAYILLSVTILGFYLHELRDIWLYVGVIVVITILLWLAKVRPNKNNIEKASEEKKIIAEDTPISMVSEPTKNEDPSRFMPKSPIESRPQPEENIETPITTSPIVIEVVPQENSAPQPEQVEEVKDQKEVNQEQQNVESSKSIEMMYCKHCGKRIEADSTFCKYCGKRL